MLTLPQCCPDLTTYTTCPHTRQDLCAILTKTNYLASLLSKSPSTHSVCVWELQVVTAEETIHCGPAIYLSMTAKPYGAGAWGIPGNSLGRPAYLLIFCDYKTFDDVVGQTLMNVAE